jgi:aldehyde dehydrogenase (NAD+)
VGQYLDQDLYRVVQGAVAETSALLKERWNHIFYTGNGAVGRIVARAAAEHLCSYTLELGGKSPVYVAEDANVRVAARRIIGTKLFNNGQVCVAPDYVTVHESVRDEFVSEVTKNIKEWWGEDPQKSASLSRIVNVRHFDRLAGMLKENHGGKIVAGGLEKADRSDRFIPPTVVLDPKLDSSLMNEEIFGPLLPIVTVSNMEQALNIINSKESSLASYVYTETTATADKFIRHTNSGGTGVNECVYHITNAETPFGGHSGGGSGVGQYNGIFGFNEFTHLRGTFTKSTWLDPSNRYPPYKEGDLKALRMLFIGTGLPAHLITGLKVVAAGAAAAFILRSKM